MRRNFILIVWSLLLLFFVGISFWSMASDRGQYIAMTNYERNRIGRMIKKDCAIQYPRSYERYRECVNRGIKNNGY